MSDDLFITVRQDALAVAVATALIDNGVRGPKLATEVERFFVTLAGARAATEGDGLRLDEEGA